MLRLDTTTRKLQAALAGAVTANQLPITVCYSDKTATAYTGGTTVINTNSATAVDICAAPAASTIRDIDTINIQNADTAAATITIRYNDNGATYTLFKAVLAVGDQLTYVHGDGWKVCDANGALKNLASDVVTLTGTQTLTNKTLTSPDINGGTIDGAVIGGATPAAGSFTTLGATGNATLGDATTDTVTVAGYMGVGGAGTANAAINVVSSALTGTSQFGAYFNPTSTSAATTSTYAAGFRAATAASAYTSALVTGVVVYDTTKGAGSTITNQSGIYINDQTNGTNNYGITSAVSSGTNKWNIYASGTAANYFAGNVGIGTSTFVAASKLEISGTNSTNYLTINNTTASDAADYRWSVVRFRGTQSGGETSTLAQIVARHDGAADDEKGNLSFCTNDGNDGEAPAERLRITSGGNIGIGTSDPTFGYAWSIASKYIGVTGDGSAVSSSYGAFHTANNRATPTVGDHLGYFSWSSVNNPRPLKAYIGGFLSGSGGANGFGGEIRFYTHADNAATDASVEHLRIDSSGNVIVTGAGGLGYGTGSGGAVTQATSRTTGVTLNKTNGAITLVSAAGSTSWQSFTVTNSTVAATDTVIVSQKSGTDLNMIFVTAVAAGSFRISFATTGGTTTEQPVFNFAVIKAITS